MTKESVLYLIQHSDRPLKRKELALKLSTSERNVTALISELRKDGNPILNELNGYFYSTNATDINHTAAIMESQAFEMLTVARSLRSTASKDGQFVML